MKRILSKFFRVATEGDTIDGREISRSWINDIAETYDSKLYGARVWLEHIRGIIPGGPFDALGDVFAVQAKEENGKMCLYAQIEPTPALVDMNRSGQKIYSSIEVQPDFAKTGKAYLSGLAVTDDPASLGTERLAFNATKFGSQYTSAQEVELEFEDISDNANDTGKSSLLEQVKAIFSRKDKQAENQFSDVSDSILQIAEQVTSLTDESDLLKQQFENFTGLSAALDELNEKFTALTSKLEGEQDPGQQDRNEASGGDGILLTDC